MSNRETILDFKSKLNRMGVSLDRTDHPLNYYKEMYFEKSNAKNKVTRDNTSFYNEKIINKKRQRSSGKKNNQIKNLDFDDISEEQGEDDFDTKQNTKGIKTTRLIESKNKRKPQKKEEIKEEEINTDKVILRSNAKKNKEKNQKNEYLGRSYNLRSRPETQFDEKNIIKFGAQNDKYNKNNNRNNKINIKNAKSPQKDYILNVNENLNESQEKPTIINKKKILLKRQNDIINNEKESMDEQYNPVEDKNNMNIDNNINQDDMEQNPINSETSSFVSNTTSRFSRFSNFTFMSLSRIGSNIVSLKNSIMNKFRRNAYLFPLVILILFGIVFFLNEKYEHFERNNIIIIFSIIMGLIILFNIIKCLKSLHNYKKMAKADIKKLYEKYNINRENMGELLINGFIRERIEENGLNEETYMKYVFPYLVKYLKKDGLYLEKQKI